MTDAEQPDVAVDLVVTGRVQGVTFRAATAQEARRAGVRGWVRNEPDGSVAVHAEGPAAAVEALVAWCASGPALARVHDVRRSAGTVEGCGSFDVRG